MEWVHCNTCYVSPSSAQSPFYFSSCGHLFCCQCVKNESTPITTPSNSDKCKVCKKKCSFLEINRTLKQEVQMYFRNPRELVGQYMQNLKSVLEFQSFHRTRLQKYQQDKSNKAVKFVKMAQMEIMKRVEMERCVVAERNQLKSELEKQQEHTKNLEILIADRDRELQQLRHKMSAKSKRLIERTNGTIVGSGGVFPSLNGTTPINTLSFLGCATSTPITDMNMFNGISDVRNSAITNNNNNNLMNVGSSGGGGGIATKLRDMFAANPEEFESPITGGGNTFLNTPAMLGIGGVTAKNESKRPGSVNNSRSSGNFF